MPRKTSSEIAPKSSVSAENEAPTQAEPTKARLPGVGLMDLFPELAAPGETPMESSARILRESIEAIQPDYIVQMVSGGRDSACSYAVAEELGVKPDLIIHGKTGTGIPLTTRFVTDYYGSLGPDFALADAGTTYVDRVMRKGFYGVGNEAHRMSYQELKASPFRAAVSKHLRQRRRGVKVMLINGMRAEESPARQRRPVMNEDGNRKNYWVNVIHHWTTEDRDTYLKAREIPINPVAVQLCRSGECMCGTMQDQGDRREASALYPEWGEWLDGLEAEAIKLHGFGWGASAPRNLSDPNQADLFMPACTSCIARKAA